MIARSRAAKREGTVIHMKLRLRVEDLAWRTIEDELVAVDVRTSTYLTANGSGMDLWRSLAVGATREDLVDELVKRYEIDAEAANADVGRFLHDLQTRGFLVEDDGAA